MTLADRFETSAHQHEQRGIEKDEALLLQRLLIRRFGPLPSERVAQIGSATTAEL